MKNRYWIEDRIAYIEILTRPHGRMMAMVDAADIELVKTPDVRWTARKNFSIDGMFYVVSSTHGPQILLHRYVLGVEDGSIFVDHMDHNGLNNRRANLRPTTNAVNVLNRSGLNKNNTSGVRGVTANRYSTSRPWLAQLKINRKHISLGSHRTKAEAAFAVAEHLYQVDSVSAINYVHGHPHIFEDSEQIVQLLHEGA